MGIKKFRIFAGPNGSGKSTLIKEMHQQFNLGYIIDADFIETSLTKKKYIDSSILFPKRISQNEWTAFINAHKDDERLRSNDFSTIGFSENFLVAKEKINSYQAAVIAEFYRSKLLEEKHTFSFETVMSHISKVNFIERAKEHGFKTYFYFICTQDPEINKQRVKNRVQKGGHNVFEQKIETRYYRSLNLLHSAFSIADRAFILDSSNKFRNVVVEKKQDEIIVHQNKVPEWIGEYLLDKL